MKDSLEAFLDLVSIWSGKNKEEFEHFKPLMSELLLHPHFAPYLLLNREQAEAILSSLSKPCFLFRIIRSSETWLGISYKKDDGKIIHGGIGLNSFLPNVPPLQAFIELLNTPVSNEIMTYGGFFPKPPLIHNDISENNQDKARGCALL